MTATSSLRIIDHAIKEPRGYRAKALAMTFESYDFGHCIFHGIALAGACELLGKIYSDNPELRPTVTFFRKSPLHQAEPHFIHNDADMGDWTAILYLNPDPPAGDGTDFWTHRETGEIESRIAQDGEAQDFVLREHVEAKFNRLLMFPASYFHSRSLFDNWGSGDEARLTQVVFGKGALS